MGTIEEASLNQEISRMSQSPSLVSHTNQSMRMDSMMGDELDDGSKGVRHGFGVQSWPDGAKYKG